jgi:ribosomal protein S18 acetylase RimI-like enzyme
MPTPDISLDPMTGAEYAAWLAPVVRHYAESHVEAGNWSPQEALQQSADAFRTLLPQGVHTEDNHLYTVRETAGGAAVGFLWIGMKTRANAIDAFVYDVGVDEAYRGKGYGRATMAAGVTRARELGAATMSLHVFGGNTTARALYSSLGFVETDVSMTLPLPA